MNQSRLILGDCLERMADIADGSVDCIISDLPYGSTACRWDQVIPFAPMWAHFKRVCKPSAAIVLTASQPFTSALVMSNAAEFRHSWVWNKRLSANGPLARYQPLKIHEDVLVFGRSISYFPQDTTPCAKTNHRSNTQIGASGKHKYLQTVTNFPKSILDIGSESRTQKVHPTQKPVALMAYLIRTYTQPCETVLDCTMGSGTTGVACKQEGRNFIGIERDPEYFAIAERRIADCDSLFSAVA